MEIVISIALILFLVTALVILVRVNRKQIKNNPKEEVTVTPASDCCGAHEVCEYDLFKMDEKRIEYFNDEELDNYKNIEARNYSPEQINEFREVLYTLKTKEIRYWLISIERRKIELPYPLIDEARMLMAEV